MSHLSDYYELILTRPRDARHLLQAELSAAPQGQASLLQPSWSHRQLIDYFRVTLDYPLLVQVGIPVIWRAWCTEASDPETGFWLKQFFAQLMRSGRLPDLVSRLQISDLELTQLEKMNAHASVSPSPIPLEPLTTPWQQTAFDRVNLTICDDNLHLAPQPPSDGSVYQLTCAFRGSHFSLKARTDGCHVMLTEGSAQPITVFDVDYLLEDELLIDYL